MDIGIFLIFNASQESSPSGEAFRGKADLLLQRELKLLFICAPFLYRYK